MEHVASIDTAVDGCRRSPSRALLQQAFEAPRVGNPDFRGFSANLTVNTNGQLVEGTVVVKGPREVTVQLPDEAIQSGRKNRSG